MNTADRSIVSVDIALRRRFAFLELEPKPELLGKVGIVDLNLLLKKLNRHIVELLDRDHRIGHSYFMREGKPVDEDYLHFIWYYRVIPLLEEYFYNNSERLQKVLGKDFIKVKVVDKDADKRSYEVIRREGDDFLTKLQELALQGPKPEDSPEQEDDSDANPTGQTNPTAG